MRGHGIFSDDFSIDSPGPWYYEQRLLGFNYRITEIQAALGISQLKKLILYKAFCEYTMFSFKLEEIVSCFQFGNYPIIN